MASETQMAAHLRPGGGGGSFLFFYRMYHDDIKALRSFMASYERYDQAISDLSMGEGGEI